ncbi:hypothetical protein [Algoriphagus mannitolivorans]|uniref:hypothetical protein n=1 Tax=Algoriphagus mannitolivorans TaxID=226504 RepID=UPI00047A69C4|nr:hypothetical protein [Algoriphagus mannitolivorans]
MKQYFSLTLVAVIAILVSCAENEEPSSPLLGTWESRVYVDSLNLWFVETMEFKNDSIFDLTQSFRSSETGPDLGYRLMAPSWYNLEGSTFKFYYSNGLFHFSTPNDPALYVPKSELKVGVADIFRIPEGVLTFTSDRKKFKYEENCFVVSPNNPCIQLPPKEYIRVK